MPDRAFDDCRESCQACKLGSSVVFRTAPPGENMRVDVYKRAENDQLFSYLAVPEGKVLPEEVTSTDWTAVSQGVDITGSDQPKYTLSPDDLVRQIGEKGYAITHLHDQSSK